MSIFQSLSILPLELSTIIHSQLQLLHDTQICVKIHSSIFKVAFPPVFCPVQAFSFVLQYLQGDILILLLLDQY